MKRTFSLGTVAAIFLLVFVAGCDRPQPTFKAKLEVLGTEADITILDIPTPEAGAIAQAVEEDLKRLDHIGYTFAPEGELHQLNEAIARGESRSVSTELLDLIMRARELYLASGGLLNPAAGELVALWEFHCNKPDCTEHPYPEEVKRLVEDKEARVIATHPSMDDLVVETTTVSSRNSSVKLEFGDIIRGYALDKGIAHLEKAGIKHAMIDLGGIARSLGSRGDHPWWVPVRDAEGQNAVGYVELTKGEAIATVRAFDKSIGKEDFVYRHVVDPRTGAPVMDVLAVTVIHGSAVSANAAATAILIAGKDGWTSAARKMGVRSIMMITRDGTMYTSTTMEERIHWNQRLEHQHLVPRPR